MTEEDNQNIQPVIIAETKGVLSFPMMALERGCSSVQKGLQVKQ